jgi:hypothetical protein
LFTADGAKVNGELHQIIYQTTTYHVQSLRNLISYPCSCCGCFLVPRLVWPNVTFLLWRMTEGAVRTGFGVGWRSWCPEAPKLVTILRGEGLSCPGVSAGAAHWLLVPENSLVAITIVIIFQLKHNSEYYSGSEDSCNVCLYAFFPFITLKHRKGFKTSRHVKSERFRYVRETLPIFNA